jgi:hypothetical protein
MSKRTLAARSAWLISGLLAAGASQAVTYTISIDGSDAIWLAGRTDLVIPAANLPWPGGLGRHGAPTPEEILETLPPIIAVTGGDEIQALDPAVGGISFFNGIGGTLYGPGGNTPTGSSLTAFGGISAYMGPQGPPEVAVQRRDLSSTSGTGPITCTAFCPRAKTSRQGRSSVGFSGWLPVSSSRRASLMP